MTEWEKWIKYYQRTFYLPAIYILCVITVIIVGLIFHRNNKSGRLFLIYLFLDSIIYSIDEYYRSFTKLSPQDRDLLITSTNVLVSFAELNAYLFFFGKILQHKKVRKLFLFFRLFFFLLILIYTINLIKGLRFTSMFKFAEYISTTEFLILLVPSLLYYIKLFSENSKEILMGRPSFWITTGIFLFIILSIPYYLINHYLLFNKYRYYSEVTIVFFYIPLILNYILLTKAFLCRKPLTV